MINVTYAKVATGVVLTTMAVGWMYTKRSTIAGLFSSVALQREVEDLRAANARLEKELAERRTKACNLLQKVPVIENNDNED